MIVILICLNAFLLYHLNRAEQARNYLDQEVIEKAVSVLEQRGVQIKAEVVPARYRYLSTVRFEASQQSQQELASRLVGADNRAETMAASGETIYESETAVLSFGAYDRIEYRLKDIPAEQAAERENSRAAAALLTELGLQKSYEVLNQWEKDDVYYLQIRQKIGEVPVYGHEATVSATGGRAVELTGRLIVGAKQGEDSNGELDAVNVLFNLADRGNAPQSEIVAMELGYIAGANAILESVSAVPAWKLTLADGTQIFYDTVTGTVRTSGEIEMAA